MIRDANGALAFARQYGPVGAAGPWDDSETQAMADSLCLLSADVDRLRAMVTVPASGPVIPNALEDEDGERWWLEGHVPPAMAVLAVVVEQMTNVDAESAEQVLVGGPTINAAEARPGYPVHTYQDQVDAADQLVRNVRHVWAKPRTEEGEYFDRCEADDQGARAWTEVLL